MHATKVGEVKKGRSTRIYVNHSPTRGESRLRCFRFSIKHRHIAPHALIFAQAQDIDAPCPRMGQGAHILLFSGRRFKEAGRKLQFPVNDGTNAPPCRTIVASPWCPEELPRYKICLNDFLFDTPMTTSSRQKRRELRARHRKSGLPCLILGFSKSLMSDYETL